MKFDKWFNKQSRLVQLILLIIPGVNWIIELLVRASRFLRTKDGKDLIVLILSIIPVTGVILGYIDLICVLLYNRLSFTKK